MHKKIFIILIIFLIGINVFGKEKENINEYRKYKIDINTNIRNINNDIDILKLKIDHNLVINDEKILDELNKINYINIDNYIKRYINILKKYSLYDDIDDINIKGLKVKEMIVNINKEEFNKLKKQYNIKKYEEKLF